MAIDQVGEGVHYTVADLAIMYLAYQIAHLGIVLFPPLQVGVLIF